MQQRLDSDATGMISEVLEEDGFYKVNKHFNLTRNWFRADLFGARFRNSSVT